MKLPGGETYGPTTVGTLREFINEGLVTERTLVTHGKTHQSLPLTALVAAVDFEKKRALRRPSTEANKSTASLAVEMAKLSLWLITMDRERPFGFLDDRFRRRGEVRGCVLIPDGSEPICRDRDRKRAHGSARGRRA